MPIPVYEALHSIKKTTYAPTEPTTKKIWTPRKTTRFERLKQTTKRRRKFPIFSIPALARKTTSVKPIPTTESPKEISKLYDRNRNDKLNSILLAYKTSRTDNEDIVDTWLKSLMSDLAQTTKTTTTKVSTPMRSPIIMTRPVIFRR